MTTTDFSKFGHREREMASDLLIEWNKGNRPDDFHEDEITIMMNDQSGYVFLTNSEYQTALMNGDKLESFYSCPECGHEGFLEDMEHGDGTQGCQEYLAQMGGTTNDREQCQNQPFSGH